VSATSPAASSSASGVTGRFEGLVDIGGYRMWITCTGDGSPTVLLDAGLDNTSAAWDVVRNRVAAMTRVCAYDRPGLGKSDARPDRAPRSAGTMADEAWRLIEAAGISGPIVLVGHSYGGLIDRLVAHRHPEAVRGLVLVDAGTTETFDGDWSVGDHDGATPLDHEASATDMAAVTTLGDVPLVVLTQGQMSGDFVPWWSGIQDALAALSSDSLHVVARASDHDIPVKAAGLVVEATTEVVDAIRTSSRLRPCGPALVAVGAECLESTMTAQVEAWQALRAGVEPEAGSFPAGRFRSELLGSDVQALIGSSPGYQRESLSWTFEAGAWTLDLSDDGGPADHVSGIYQAMGNQVTFRIPDDWTIPRTPGVNRLRWRVDGDGTIRLTQVDHELPEPWFSAPLRPVGAG
jgi:pimeloyl-ACP methyl ester carboxylesterase